MLCCEVLYRDTRIIYKKGPTQSTALPSSIIRRLLPAAQLITHPLGTLVRKQREAVWSCSDAHTGLVSPPAGASPDRLVADPLPVGAERVKSRGAAHVHIRVPGKVEAHDDNQVGQKQDAALEVVALPLAVHVAQQEDAQDHGYHVPLREEEAERPVAEVRVGANRAYGVQSREQNKRGNLQQTNLQRVCRANFHGQSDVAIHCKGNGVLKKPVSPSITVILEKGGRWAVKHN